MEDKDYYDSFDCEIQCEEEYNEDGWFEFEPGRFNWNEMDANP